jgi:hypothetical protein
MGRAEDVCYVIPCIREPISPPSARPRRPRSSVGSVSVDLFLDCFMWAVVDSEEERKEEGVCWCGVVVVVVVWWCGVLVVVVWCCVGVLVVSGGRRRGTSGMCC